MVLDFIESVVPKSEDGKLKLKILVDLSNACLSAAMNDKNTWIDITFINELKNLIDTKFIDKITATTLRKRKLLEDINYALACGADSLLSDLDEFISNKKTQGEPK